MLRPLKVTELFVYMNGVHVGILKREISGALSFTYDEKWVVNENGRPISLSMPLTERTYKGGMVYNFFDNLLPDNELIRERIQARFQAKTKSPFDLLTYIGADCVGALQLLVDPDIHQENKIQAKAVDDKTIAQLLKNYRSAPLGMDRESDFRISIAGAQEKTALLRYRNRWCVPHGITPTSHIIKLPMGRIQHSNIDLSESVENEWLCLQVLSEFGLRVSNAQMTNFSGVKTLVVERFDRRWNKNKKWLLRLPQEDMCQALGVSSGLKYESDGGPGIVAVMKLLSGSENALRDRRKFMKAIFIFWLLGAIDGHAKNFSIFIEAGGKFRLTPIYDVMSAYPLAAKRQMEWKKLKMAMALTGKNRHYHWDKIKHEHWLATAKLCKFPNEEMEDIINEVFDGLDNVIDRVSEKIPNKFPSQIAGSIFKAMKKRKLNYIL